MCENIHNPVALYPDCEPVPSVLLEEDLIRFLRLRELGIKNPAGTLKYYRDKRLLSATKIGGRNCYTVQAALALLEALTDKKKKRA